MAQAACCWKEERAAEEEVEVASCGKVVACRPGSDGHAGNNGEAAPEESGAIHNSGGDETPDVARADAHAGNDEQAATKGVEAASSGEEAAAGGTGGDETPDIADANAHAGITEEADPEEIEAIGCGGDETAGGPVGDETPEFADVGDDGEAASKECEETGISGEEAVAGTRLDCAKVGSAGDEDGPQSDMVEVDASVHSSGIEQECCPPDVEGQDISTVGSLGEEWQGHKRGPCRSAKHRIVTPAPARAFGSSQVWASASSSAKEKSILARALRGPGASQVLPYVIEMACTRNAAQPCTRALAETGYAGADTRPDLLPSHFARAQALDLSVPLLKHW